MAEYRPPRNGTDRFRDAIGEQDTVCRCQR